MRRVYVTGASGFVGGHLLPALRQADWHITSVDRDWTQDTVDLAEVDTVFHLAGLAHAGAQGADRAEMFRINVERTVALYERAIDAKVRRFIWLSSIKVLGDSSQRPLRVDASREPGDVYAESKAAAELALLQKSSNTTQLCIVRPPLVYGPGVKANFLTLVKAAASNWPLPLGAARAPRAWVGVDNLVDLLGVLATSEAATKQTIWHVRDEEMSSVRQILNSLRVTLGQAANLWPIPEMLAMTLAKLVGREEMMSRLFLPFEVDMSDTQHHLGWQPPYTQQDQLEKVLAWYRTQ